MNSMINCVFWNIRDARLPNQRGGFIPKDDEKSEAQQTRKKREDNNIGRAPGLAKAIVNIALSESVDVFLFAEYHLDQSLNGGDTTLCKELEKATGKQFIRIENRLRRSQSTNLASPELGEINPLPSFLAWITVWKAMFRNYSVLLKSRENRSKKSLSMRHA